MSQKLYEESNIQGIASAIREKNGTQNQYTVSQMPAAVRAIQTQPDLEVLNATENGDYLPSVGKDGFSSVSVNVESGEAVIQPLSATQNGTYTPPSGVDGYAPVTVNVSGGGEQNILRESDYKTTSGGSFSFNKEVTISSDGDYYICVTTWSNQPTISINGIAQPLTFSDSYAFAYIETLTLSTGDLINISVSGSGKCFASAIITKLQ